MTTQQDTNSNLSFHVMSRPYWTRNKFSFFVNRKELEKCFLSIITVNCLGDLKNKYTGGYQNVARHICDLFCTLSCEALCRKLAKQERDKSITLLTKKQPSNKHTTHSLQVPPQDLPKAACPVEDCFISEVEEPYNITLFTTLIIGRIPLFL